MTSFDELIGEEPTGAERERLQNVHGLLLEAGPPPELSPALAAGPPRASTVTSLQAFVERRRAPILATAAAAAVVVLAIGVGLHRHASNYRALSLRGTSFAPRAAATLEVLPKQQMKLEVSGLPARKQSYVVYLVRGGHRIASCGSFTVSNANRRKGVSLRSPYPVQSSDKWVVTFGGRTVLAPVT
jgi:hypothetical protein